MEVNWGLTSLNQGDVNSPDLTGAFGAVCTSCPSPVVASFTFSPTNPTNATTIIFNAVASGGTAPYTYSWQVNSNTATGQTLSIKLAPGTYTATLTVRDSGGQSTSSSQTVTVTSTSTGCTTNCNGGTHPTTWPRLIGWGGNRLDEAAVGAGGINPNTSSEASCCFLGETATNLQLTVERMKALGYNTIRVDFDPFCSDNTDSNYMSAYSAANLQRAITIAQFYHFWIIVDYHGYIDMETTTTGMVVSGFPTLQACWLNFWSSVTNQFRNSYPPAGTGQCAQGVDCSIGIIWEPLNEPCMPTPCNTSGNDVAGLSAGYQAWINQVRGQGDTHWIVVGNLCSNNCAFADFSQGYPNVIDPQGKVFLNLHAYMGYPYVQPWNTGQADNYAQSFYNAMISGQQKTGWPSLNTEIGTDPLCTGVVGGGSPLCNSFTCPAGDTPQQTTTGPCATNSAGYPPDDVVAGSAGYTTVTYEFASHLITLMNTAQVPINWIGWTSGSWTNSPTLPVLGSLDPNNGWGTKLGVQSIGNPTCNSNGCGFINISFTSLFIAAVASVIGVLGVGLVLVPRRRGK